METPSQDKEFSFSSLEVEMTLHTIMTRTHYFQSAVPVAEVWSWIGCLVPSPGQSWQSPDLPPHHAQSVNNSHPPTLNITHL